MMIGLQAQGTIRTGRSLWLCQWRQAAVALTLMLLAASACQSIPAAENRHPGVVWMTSYEEAMAVSQQTGHPILTVFTGSDWCPHCKTLEDNVLSSEAFRSWTDAKVVLLMIDLPQAGISQAVRSERSQVCIQYGIRTFPSVLLLGPDGKRLAGQSGYNGQSATVWIAQMATHLPPPQLVEKEAETVCETLEEAVATARGSKRPILLLVSRSGDSIATLQSKVLIDDPEFGAFIHDNFVVATVGPTVDSGSQCDQSMENLLGGAELPPDAIELIVTDDGQTPLFSQSGSQPAYRIISGLKRFLAARQVARHSEAARR